MLSIYISLILIFININIILSLNNYPIILVHGFSGWGRSEMFGIKYFGGLVDIQEDLKKQFPNSKVFTVSIGPISSVWDRSCEIYAQIKGGVVDYGEYHSNEFSHSRYGRNYTGFYPEWGTLDENGEIRKVHIIAHSMGGLDSRQLTHLLHYGNEQERGFTKSGLSNLFSGNNDWVSGVITISTPHDGTTLCTEADKFSTLVTDLVGVVAELAGAAGKDDVVYDFQLDQFGLYREPGESFSTYAHRVFSSSIWTPGFEDISLWDMMPTNTLKLAPSWSASPNVFYMTYSTADTYKVPILETELANPSMLAILWPNAAFMGAFKQNNGIVDLGSTWWENDGVVNTVAQAGPALSEIDTIRNFNGTVERGVFNFMKKLNNWGHISIVGLNVWPVLPIYIDFANQLFSLPVNGTFGEIPASSFSSLN